MKTLFLVTGLMALAAAACSSGSTPESEDDQGALERGATGGGTANGGGATEVAKVQHISGSFTAHTSKFTFEFTQCPDSGSELKGWFRTTPVNPGPNVTPDDMMLSSLRMRCPCYHFEGTEGGLGYMLGIDEQGEISLDQYEGGSSSPIEDKLGADTKRTMIAPDAELKAACQRAALPKIQR